ncbi:MAG: L,D-transpeptidase family protein [Proteobacteria bacterium]|nr:L,D-transpeptidase family protein [Pseudomonadota bacterium]
MIKKLCLFALTGMCFSSALQALPDPLQDPRVKKIYDYFQGKELWVQNGTWNDCAKTLLDTFSHVEDEGLWQQDYTPFLEALQKADLSTPEAQSHADQLLTLAALNYISDMNGERLTPHSVDKNTYVKQPSIDEVELLKGYASLSSQCGWIHGLSPSIPEYQHLKQLLVLYRQKQTQGGWPQLPKGTKLAKGDKGPLVEILKTQLITQDALPNHGGENDIFDETIETAVKDFQKSHGLEEDGKVGGATLTALNIPVEERIRSIIVSLEKQRWFPRPLPARYIQVNVPGFYLKAVEGGAPTFYMPIITGKEYTKTPIFNASMTEIIFNPSWHVPASIVGEILPKIQRNPETYARKGYRVENEGGSVRIVQSPGPANSLGRIRFTIDSPFSVYLHGTPNPKLFLKANRALSHGCIRVQDPTKLAEFVFQDPTKWSLERISSETSTTATKRVKLDQSLAVFITYFTVFQDENNKMNFVEDKYKQDKELWLALENAKRNYKEEQ